MKIRCIFNTLSFGISIICLTVKKEYYLVTLFTNWLWVSVPAVWTELGAIQGLGTPFCFACKNNEEIEKRQNTFKPWKVSTLFFSRESHQKWSFRIQKLCWLIEKVVRYFCHLQRKTKDSKVKFRHNWTKSYLLLVLQTHQYISK